MRKGDISCTSSNNAWRDLLRFWHQIQPLIHQGYKILNKKVTMGLPGPCMPAFDCNYDIGIGSPYGLGAEKIWQFLDKTIDNILLGPPGKTFAKTQHSPYVSDDEQPNPFFLPPEKLLDMGLISQNDMDKVCQKLLDDKDIDFKKVEKNFRFLLTKLEPNKQKQNATIQHILDEIKAKDKHRYISDLQIQVPLSVLKAHPDLFLKRFTLGTPADAISDQDRDWGFPVFDPDKLWDGKNLGPGGKLWQHLIDLAIKDAKCGLRIDHFIGFVNPYVMSHRTNIPSGRLYSSSGHPVFKKYAYTKPEQFYRIVEQIVMPVLKRHKLTKMDLYPEDIGARPPQLDDVLQHFGLGRLIVAQFKEPYNPKHMYQLMNTQLNDIATIDTHDTPSAQMFFDNLDDAGRYIHAQSLARSLRFNYDDSLKSTEQLTRMQWGELLSCPAIRVQAFFTSWIGQRGYYSHPNNINSWKLRCASNFDQVYFGNLLKGLAYNPLDAIALAIYARGDQFYNKYADFVAKLRSAEDTLKNLIRAWQS